MKRETVINVFPSEDDQNRLVIAVEQHHQSSQLVLRQESYSSDVGWFVQSRIDVQPEQVDGLRMALSSKRSRTVDRAKERRPIPAILSFESAGRVG